MLKRLIITIAVLGQAVTQGLGQGTKADYKRAAEIRERFSGKVYNEKIHAHWIGGNFFWYETNVRSKREYILVNGSKGRRRVFSDKDKFDEILKRRKVRENRLAVRQNEKQRSRRNESSDNQPNVSRSGSVSPDGRWRAFIKNYNLFVHDL